MSYMDQGMDCALCGREHSQFSTGICLTCEAAERDAKAKAAWDAKTPFEKAVHYLEKWADPQAMTFNKHDAKFVLGVVKSLAPSPAQAQPFTMLAYAKACRATHPFLADDIEKEIK